MRTRLRPGPAAIGLLLSLVGCSAQPPAQPGSAAAVGLTVPPGTATPPRSGRPFDVTAGESLLTILAFRAGTLARAGHNHVIASHDLGGTFYVPDDPRQATFEIHVPVSTLAIDEPELRANEGPDFPVEVPQSAREGTRHNMLSEALLDGEHYPQMVLTGLGLADAGHAQVQVNIRGQTHTVLVPVTYAIEGDRLTASGELPLKQTDLGLTPFSAMLGALQVQDEMRVRFRVTAHAGATRGAPVTR